jgi:copper(I)-binding protein
MIKRTITYTILLILGAGGLSGAVQAKEYQLGNLVISDPWARFTPGLVRNSAAYIPKLVNNGRQMDRLVNVSSTIAEKVELHRTIVENNIVKMRHVDGVDLEPGKSVTIKPGGYHIMLKGLYAPLVVGQSFPLKLTFEKAGDLEVTVVVRKFEKPLDVKMNHHNHGTMKK